MDTKTVEIRPECSGSRPPLLRALEYLLYAVLFVVLVLPPAFVYGLIIKDAANFREYEDVWNFYDTPGFSYGAYRVEKDWTAISDYSKIPAGEKFEYTIDSGWRSSTDTYTMVENPVYTLEDGMSVMLWQREDEYDSLEVYVLENGDAIWLPLAHCIFDRSTGEQVSIDRLCVGGSFEAIKLELTRRMFATRDPNFDSSEDYDFTEEDIAEAAEHLDPADICFYREHMSTTLMPGSISRYPENAFGIGVRYSKIEDLITLEP